MSQKTRLNAKSRPPSSFVGIPNPEPRTPNPESLLALLPDWWRERLQHAGRLADLLRVNLYLVGGIVRDLLLGIPNTDVDLVVEGDGIRFAVKFARVYGAEVKRHLRFRTAVVTFSDGTKLDVVTARAERYDAPAALPVIEPSSLREDLCRRDFTVNAIAIRLNAARFGELVNLFGGQADLERRVIRVLHPQSFIDDPTRLFRAVRLEQRLGLTMDEATAQAFRLAVTGRMIDRLSGQRLGDQLRLVCEERDPWPVVLRLDELGVLRAIHPALAATPAVKVAFDAIRAWQSTSTINPESWTGSIPWLFYLLGLLYPCDDRAVHALSARLAPSRRVAESLRSLSAARGVEAHLASGASPSPVELHRRLRSLPSVAVLFLALASPHDTVRRGCWEYYDRLQHIRLSIDGETLRGMGIPPGRVYRQILDGVFQAKLNGAVRTEHEERQKAQEIWERLSRSQPQHSSSLPV